MALETANTILDLNPSWPTGTDNVSDGDNHIRMMKAVLQAAYPVGSVLYNTTGTNPSTYIGGTWVATSQGRAIVGVGDNGESTWTAGEERGSETHTLTADEVPVHSHDGGSLSVSAHNESFAFSIQRGDESQNIIFDTQNITLTYAGDANTVDSSNNPVRPATRQEWNINHSHTVSGSTADAGGGAAHNNIPPSKALYVWERTA